MADIAELLDRPKDEKQQDITQSDDNLDTLVAWFEDAEEATETARAASERDRDYYDNKQFTPAELKELRARGQPDTVINRIAPKVDFLIGYEASNRTDPRAFPRTPQDEQAAEAATDALRFVADDTDLDGTFSNVWENLLIEGYGGLEMTVEQLASGDVKIMPVRWDWDRLFFDPHARKADFSDARYLGGVLWMDGEDAKRRWPDKADAIELTMSDTSATRTYDDKPSKWVSTTGSRASRKRVRIVQMYHREDGKWMHCTFTKGGKLEEIEVPFVDQDGQSWCPMILQSAYVDRDNNRYGLVRRMIGVQDEINKRRSKALHRLTMRQTVGEHGAVDDEEAVRQEMAKPDGQIWVNPGFRFEMLNGAEQLAGELQLLQEAKNEIELMGPNAAMLGKDADAPSGRAILANQQSGQTEIAMLLDRHRHLKRRTFERVWDLVRQYKTKEWWVRVTDDEKNVKFVGMNRPVTLAEELKRKAAAQARDENEAEAMAAQIDQKAEVDPQLQQVVRIENNPTEMHMDITVEDVPNTANVQEEQFQMLTSLAPAVVFPPQVYIEASSLRNKKRLLEVMNGQQQQDPVAAEAQKIELEQMIKEREAKIELMKAQALKARVDADVADAQLGLVTDPRIVNGSGEPQSVPPPGNGRDMPPPGSTGEGGFA